MTTTTPASGAADLPDALLTIAREIEALKRECGMDPESAIAIQNGRYMAISYKVRALAAGQATAAPAEPDPTPGDHPQPCDSELFESGVSVGLFDIPKWTAEALCKGIAAATGARVDWHYIAGRVHVKALPAPTSAEGAAYAALPDAPLPVFSKGPWTFKETGQNFSGAELDEAAFVAYRDRASHGQAPATQQPEGDVVAYLDVGVGGYLDLGSDLSEDALQQLPKGRHALVIAGTYGIDGYVAAPQPSPKAQEADSVQEDAARWHWMAEYLVGTRTDLDDDLIASATVDELRKLVDADLAARKQGEKQ